MSGPVINTQLRADCCDGQTVLAKLQHSLYFNTS